MRYMLTKVAIVVMLLAVLTSSLVFHHYSGLPEPHIEKNLFFKIAFRGKKQREPRMPFEMYNYEGVPLYELRTDQLVLHPVAIAQRLTHYYGTGFSTQSDFHRKYQIILRNIIQSQELIAESGSLQYTFEFVAGKYQYRFEPGWGSAMAQGTMLEFMAHVYFDYPSMRREILDFGKQLMAPLEQGGELRQILVIGDEKLAFFAEYPADPPPVTLNGFMFTLIGLYEFGKVTGSPQASRLYEEGMETLLNILPFYNTHPLSTYDLAHLTYQDVPPNIAPRYHEIHVKQLGHLYELSGHRLLRCIKESMEAKHRSQKAKYEGALPNRLEGSAIRWDDTCAGSFWKPQQVYKQEVIEWER